MNRTFLYNLNNEFIRLTFKFFRYLFAFSNQQGGRPALAFGSKSKNLFRKSLNLLPNKLIIQVYTTWTCVWKEFLSIWQDNRARFLLIFPPLWQLFIFAFAATLDVKNVSLGVLNRDIGEQSFDLVQKFRGSPTFKEIISLNSFKEAASFLDDQKGPVVISIDPEFSKNLLEGKPALCQILLDGRKSNTAQIIANYIQEITASFTKEKIPHVPPGPLHTELILRNDFNPNLLYYWFTVPSLLAILTMVEALLLTTMAVARERELGTWDQLLVSPLTPRQILIGKSIPSILIAIAEGTIIVLTILFGFQIPFHGSLLLLYLGMFFFVLSITGIGLFISSLCATQQSALLAAFFFITPAVLLSGFATPIENMPHWLQPITYLNPLRYFLFISRGTFLKGIGFVTTLKQIIPLAILSIAVFAVALRRLRKQLESQISS